MDQRLVSENIMQCGEQASFKFSATGHLIAYQTENYIRVKAFSKEIQECNVKIDNPITEYFLSVFCSSFYLNVQYEKNGVEIYQIYQEGNILRSKIHFNLQKACSVKKHQNGLLFTQLTDSWVVKRYEYETGKIVTIGKCAPKTQFMQNQGKHIVSKVSSQQSPSILQIYNFNEQDYQQNPKVLDYIKCPLVVYLDRYILHNSIQKHQVQIYDLVSTKLVGKFQYLGDILFSKIIDNYLLIVSNNGNVDKYYIFSLKQEYNEENFIQNRIVYEKGKGSCFEISNISEEYGNYICSKKGSIPELNKQCDQKVLLLYVQPKNKAKIEIMRISHERIQQNNYKEESLNTIINSNANIKKKEVKKNQKDNELLEMQKVRIGASMKNVENNSHANIEEIQKKLIQHLVDVKMRAILNKFTQLQARLSNVEVKIEQIYKKIENSLQKINKEEIRKNVENLFEKVTPQFQSYFSEVFRQISGVLDQGVSYYSAKLAKQSQSHCEALNQIISTTFDANEEIIELGRKEAKNSEATEKSIAKLLQIRKKWEEDTKQLMMKIKLPQVNVPAKRILVKGMQNSKQSPNREPPTPKQP